MIIYSIISFIWFDYLIHHIFLIKRNKIITAFNNKTILILCLLIAISWIISIPVYVLPLERKYF